MLASSGMGTAHAPIHPASEAEEPHGIEWLMQEPQEQPDDT